MNTTPPHLFLVVLLLQLQQVRLQLWRDGPRGHYRHDFVVPQRLEVLPEQHHKTRRKEGFGSGCGGKKVSAPVAEEKRFRENRCAPVSETKKKHVEVF